MAYAPDYTPISISGNAVPGSNAIGNEANIATNWNSGGWADNGPGTGGWDPTTSDTSSTTLSSQSDKLSDKYSIDNYSYPSDLMGPRGEYGNNYAMFYINVAADSKLLKEGSGTEIVNDVTNRQQGQAVAQARRAGGGTAQAIGGYVAPIAVGSFAGFTATAALGALGGGVAIANQTSQFEAQTKRLKTAIALHMPNLMTTRYGVNWEEKDTLLESVIGSGISGGTELYKAFTEGGTKDMAASVENAAKSGKLSSGIAALALNLPGGAIAQKLSGVAPNPRREQLFRSVDFRTFTFQYEFYPRDAKEAQNVRNIIEQFKYHMHPEYKDSNAFLYVYPSEFDIVYYHGTEENRNVNRHTSCVLTEMSVNYSPQGQFTSFDGGMPSQVNVVLTFRELAEMTKERIKEGM